MFCHEKQLKGVCEVCNGSGKVGLFGGARGFGIWNSDCPSCQGTGHNEEKQREENERIKKEAEAAAQMEARSKSEHERRQTNDGANETVHVETAPRKLLISGYPQRVDGTYILQDWQRNGHEVWEQSTKAQRLVLYCMKDGHWGVTKAEFLDDESKSFICSEETAMRFPHHQGWKVQGNGPLNLDNIHVKVVEAEALSFWAWRGEEAAQREKEREETRREQGISLETAVNGAAEHTNVRQEAGLEGKQRHQEIRYLPTQLEGVPVLRRQAGDVFVADNTKLKSKHGIFYRRSKNLQDKETMMIPWGASVKGDDEGDGWIRVLVPQQQSARLSSKGVANAANAAPNATLAAEPACTSNNGRRNIGLVGEVPKNSSRCCYIRRGAQ